MYFSVFKEYCVEMDDEEGVMTGFVCDFVEANMHVSRAEIVIMAVCMFASVVFLSATIFIYSSVKELRDLHGKSLICHASSLLAGYILLVIVNLFDVESKRIGLFYCLALFVIITVMCYSSISGYFIQFAILSCFFWMLVMCIDIFLHTW
jgi:G protein-coupled receptor Mth (Methuselah protein)